MSILIRLYAKVVRIMGAQHVFLATIAQNVEVVIT
jgi:hypothetical protein